MLRFKYLGSGSLHNVVSGRVNKVRKDISKLIASMWAVTVQSSRLSSRAKARYVGAIEPYSPPRAGAYVQDKIAQLLETGWKRFDMKPGLLKGKRYSNVPLLEGEVRTVSPKSKGKSWVHPGFRGARIMHKVERRAAAIIRKMIANASG